jgi:hypothetical protein
MTTQLNWNDGTSDKITLTYGATEGTVSVAVSSDPFTGYTSRSRDIVFQVSAGGTTISRTLTVVQSAKDIIIITYNDTYITSNEVAVGYEQQ